MKPNSMMTKTDERKLAAAVATALTHLSKAQDVLPIDDDLIARDRKAAIALVRFPTEVLQAASEVLAAEPSRLSSFDSSAVNDSLTYDVAMTKVLRQAEALVAAIQTSLLKRRAPGIEQSLALYAWLKRGSVRTDGSLAKYADALAPHVILRRRRASKAASPQPSTTPPATSAGASTSAPPVAAPVTNGASAPATAH